MFDEYLCGESVTIGEPSNPDVELNITKVKLNKGPHYYTLDLTYTLETPSEIREIRLPAVQLPLSKKIIHINTKKSPRGYISECNADLGFGKTELDPDMDGHFYYEKLVEIKTKEMTLAEIEKKLGHKVKIVSKKTGDWLEDLKP